MGQASWGNFYTGQATFRSNLSCCLVENLDDLTHCHLLDCNIHVFTKVGYVVLTALCRSSGKYRPKKLTIILGGPLNDVKFEVTVTATQSGLFLVVERSQSEPPTLKTKTRKKIKKISWKMREIKGKLDKIEQIFLSCPPGGERLAKDWQFILYKCIV